MPSVRRPSGQTSARLALLVLTFVCVAALAFVCIEPPASSACSIAMPKPLRALYRDSALVAVARVGDSVVVEVGEGERMAKTALRITSLLKGESRERVVNLSHDVWESADENSPYAYAKNDVLLVFLNPADEGDGYISADYERGLKKLSPDDLKVYVSRLEELARIMRSEKPDAAALTEWLVRCAEEPATRWEGAYELASGASLPEDPEEPAADSGSGAANTEQSVAVVGAVVNNDEQQAKGEDDSAARRLAAATNGAANKVGDEPGARLEQDEVVYSSKPEEEEVDFAALLTPAHKERLMTTLLAAEELYSGEQMLLRLAANWKDARLVPFCLKHLVRMADQPSYHAEDIMRIVAHSFNDRTLIKFAAAYSKAASYQDLHQDTDYGADVAEDSEATADERAAARKEIEEEKAAAAEARFQRSGKLRHFLALADQPQKP